MPYVSAVVNVVRMVQAEHAMAVTRELREMMRYDASVESLARAIIHGRWRELNFKQLEQSESSGAWLGKEQPGELPDWSTQLGLFQAIWTPLVCVYTAVHRRDHTAHRVLTVLSTETQNAIRLGMPTSEAVSGLVVKFFSLLEEDVRALQRGAGPEPELRTVWTRCQEKPFYKSFSLQVAASRGGSAHERLVRRIATLEAKLTNGGGSGSPRTGGSAGGGSGGSGGSGKTSQQDNGAVAGSPRERYIPSAELRKWMDANPGKCFKFHLKGHCDGGNSCKFGTH